MELKKCSENVPSLSILAGFDDLVRAGEFLLTGTGNELIEFVKRKYEDRLEKKNTQQKIQQLREDLKALKSTKAGIQSELERTKISSDVLTKKLEEIKKENMLRSRQVDVVKTTLFRAQSYFNDETKEKLAFLTDYQTTSKFDLSTVQEISETSPTWLNISFDKTDEDLDGVNQSSNNTLKTEGKSVVKKGNDEQGHVIPSSCRVGNSLREKLEKEHSYRDPVKRFKAPLRPTCKSDNDVLEVESKIDDLSQSTTPLRQLFSTSCLTKAHVFCTKIIFTPETCIACGFRLKLYKLVLKCEVCNAICHSECKEKVPLPCVKRVNTPNKNVSRTIAAFSPSSSPMIPSLLLYCIREIEARGMKEVGIYRTSASGRDVKELKEKFFRKGKYAPCLKKMNLNVICGVVTDFIKSLSEPIIARTLWKEFVFALGIMTENNQLGAVHQAVCRMPQSNRETLSFLILHFKCVSSNPSYKISMEHLVKIFAPIIVGCSASEHQEKGKLQQDVMRMLLNAPVDFWNSLFSHSKNLVSKSRLSMASPAMSKPNTSKATSRSSGVTLEKIPLPPRKKN